MNRKEIVLIVGGAGYVGTVTAHNLLERGYRVKCLDNMIYKHNHALNGLLGQDDFEYISADFRDRDIRDEVFSGVSHVVMLAGLVGDPITKKYPILSNEINCVGVQDFISEISKRKLGKFLFISTCSNYGLIGSDELADENYRLNPLSTYASAKVAAEQRVLESLQYSDCCPVILRFATAFGLSPRMRFDLTVNEFARDLAMGRELEVFDADTWRPYCHVKDFARLIYTVLKAENDIVRSQVFNAGGASNNATKRMLADMIQVRLPKSNIRYKEHGTDPRNYRVDFQKVRTVLGFEPEYSIEDGIDEIIGAVRDHRFPDSSIPSLYGNYLIPGAE